MATFTFREKEVHQSFHNLVDDPVHGIFRAPSVSIQLPFKAAGVIIFVWLRGLIVKSPVQ
mgnify:CR=1 FL=1